MRARAARGAAVLGLRGMLIHGLGIGANLALAALLVPRDFGLVAIGMALVLMGNHAADGGLPAVFIRRRRPPLQAELRAALGLQLAVASAIVLAAAVAAVVLPVGHDGFVVATMALALPIMMLRTPGLVLLERSVSYGVIARSDIGEAVVFYVFAVVAVALGAGVWGVAMATVARAVTSTAIVLAAGPVGPLAPRWAWREVRPLLRLGVRYQAASVSGIGRDQVVNVAIGAVGGLAILGVWNLAVRILQVPILLLGNAGRVAFPALAQIVGAGEDPEGVLRRIAASLALLIAIVAVPMTALTLALPELVGAEWADVPPAVLWASAGLIVGASLNIACGAYLMAVGEPGALVKATLAGAAVGLAITTALLADLGAAAAGIGSLAAELTSAAMVLRRVRARSGARLGRHHSAAAAVGVVALGVAWIVGHAPDDRLLGAAAGLLAGLAALALLIAATARVAFGDLVGLARRAGRARQVKPLLGAAPPASGEI